MNSVAPPSSVKSDLETASAPFLAFGILLALGGLPAMGISVFVHPFDTSLLLLGVRFFGAGLCLAVVGFGLRRRWRYLLPVAAVLGIPGLLQVPIGTLLFGLAFYSLWKRREYFYPFDRRNIPPA